MSETGGVAGKDVVSQGLESSFRDSCLCNPTEIWTLCSSHSKNADERQHVTRITQDVRDPAGCPEDNQQDQNLILIHKQDQSAVAVT